MKVLATMVVLLGMAASYASNWKNQSELGVTSVSGNTDTSTANALHSSIWEKEKMFSLGKGPISTVNLQTLWWERNWSALLRYDRKINDRWTWFLAQGGEGNKFNGFEWRSNTDFGAKYFIIPQENKDDTDYLLTEIGYRFTHEERLVNTDPDFKEDSNQGRLYIEYSKPVSKTFSFKSLLEYLKTFDSDERNMGTFEVSGNSALSSMFTLKVAYTVTYDDSLEDRGFESDSDKTTIISLIATY